MLKQQYHTESADLCAFVAVQRDTIADVQAASLLSDLRRSQSALLFRNPNTTIAPGCDLRKPNQRLDAELGSTRVVDKVRDRDHGTGKHHETETVKHHEQQTLHHELARHDAHDDDRACADEQDEQRVHEVRDCDRAHVVHQERVHAGRHEAHLVNHGDNKDTKRRAALESAAIYATSGAEVQSRSTSMATDSSRPPIAQPHEGVVMSTASSTASSTERFYPSSTPPSLHAASHSNRQPQPSQQRTKQQHPLLFKRVYTLEEYARIFATRKKGQTKYAPGELPTPIPVPLRAGETFRDYEHQFIAWLRSKKMTLQDAFRDPNHERSLRINFANLRVQHGKVMTTSANDGNANGVLSTPPPSSHLQSPLRAHLPNGKRSNSAGNDDEDGRLRKRAVLQRPEAEYQAPPSVSSSPSKEQRLPPTASPGYTDHTDTHSPPESDPASHTNAAATIVASSAATDHAATSSNRCWTQCTAVLPKATANFHKFAAAYVACACRACLCDWNLMLTERLESMENELRNMWNQLEQTTTTRSTSSDCASVKCEKHPGDGVASNTDADIKKECDASPPVVTKEAGKSGDNQDDPKAKDVAGEPIVSTSRSASDLAIMTHVPIPENSSTHSSQSSTLVDTTTTATASPPSPGAAGCEIPPFPASSWPRRDPIQAQMLHEYNTLNSEIILNEQVVNDSLKRVQTMMLTDMSSAMEELEQIEQIKTSIRGEMANRDAALAMLIAYTWRSRPQELESQMEQCGTLNITHVHRASHERCAMLASQIKDKQACIVRVKAMLDTVLVSVNEGDAAHIDKLSALGAQLTQAEQDVVTLELEQLDEFMRLLQFSHDIRTLCRMAMATKLVSA
ncbi:hypothetical protein FI667_g8480, partial [Globisporangium splendens]